MSIISAGTTSGTALVQTADTNGNLIIKTGASGTTAMTIGANQVTDFAATPTINGGAFPAGAMTLISTQTASGQASIEWTGLSTYKSYSLVISGLYASSGWGVQVGTGSTPTWSTSSYTASFIVAGTGSPVTVYTGSSKSDFFGTIAGGWWAALPVNGELIITGSSTRTTASGVTGTSDVFVFSMQGFTTSVVFSNVTAIRLNCPSGTFTAGAASLYGISG